MSLKIKQLASVVKKAKNDEKAFSLLKEETTRILGPIIDTTTDVTALAHAINDRLIVLSLTGRKHEAFKPSTILKFASHASPEVRKMAVNLLPESFAPRFMNDVNRSVRLAAAKKLPVNALNKFINESTKDDAFYVLLKEKKSKGLQAPEVVKGEFDLYGDKRLGDAIKQSEGPELSDVWYEEVAFKLLQDYGRNIEYNWEELAVSNFCRHTKVTSGVEIDAEKLLKKLFELIKEREDAALSENRACDKTLFKLVEYFKKDDELVNESIDESDSVEDLMHADYSGPVFIEHFETLFCIKKSDIPAALKKFSINENNMSSLKLPMKARAPYGMVRALDEAALDMYVLYWNEHQKLLGESIMLRWTHDPIDISMVSFKVELK